MQEYLNTLLKTPNNHKAAQKKLVWGYYILRNYYQYSKIDDSFATNITCLILEWFPIHEVLCIVTLIAY
jgi:hypothetical protein